MKRNNKGVSLIVLSITILVMAILAATAIIALEDSGIIGRSKNTVKNNNYSDEYTRLVVIKNGILTDNLGTITVTEYVTELENKGLIESAKTTNADGSVTVTTKTGFDVIVSQNGTSDLNIVIDGYTQSNNNSGNSGGNTGEDTDGNTQQYTLSGTWIFNENIIEPSSDEISQKVEYVMGGYEYNEMFWNEFENMRAISGYDVEYDGWIDLCYWDVNANTAPYWEAQDRTITFTSKQQVSQEFYDWFTANATKVS